MNEISLSAKGRHLTTEINEMVTITRSVIARDGFEGFLPTACFPKRKEVAVLKGVPVGVDIETATMGWASNKAKMGEEYLIAFRVDSTHFKVIRRNGKQNEEAVFGVDVA